MGDAAEGKLFGALLNGVTKRVVFGDQEFTDQVLKQEIYPNLEEDAFAVLLAKATELLIQAAQGDYDLQQADAAATTARTHPSQFKLSEGQKNGFVKFWKAQKQKIHDQRVKDALWGSRLKTFSWRIDLKTKSKHIRELNDPTAIFEFDIKDDDKVDVVRFEMDAAQVTDMLEQLQRIDTILTKA